MKAFDLSFLEASLVAAFRILACDGGGIRGLVTALLLQELDRQFGIVEKIDFFAGTSAGGINALALAAGIPIAKVVDLFTHQGAQIFKPLSYQWSCLVSSADRPESAATETSYGTHWLTQAMYDPSGLLQAVVDALANRPNPNPPDPQVGQLTKRALVATFQLNDGQHWRATAIDNFAGSVTKNVLVSDAIAGTAAAPIYFPPHFIEGLGYCSDGGLYANNPSMVAIAAALADGKALEDLRVLSIGTGQTVDVLNVSSPNCYGVNYWLWPEQAGSTPAFPLLAAMFDGVAAATDHQAEQILGITRYARANVPLGESIPLDAYRQVDELTKITVAYMKSEAWGNVVAFVRDHFVTS